MKQKIGFAIGMLLILALIFSSPWADKRHTSDFGSILQSWGYHQQETSEKFTTDVVSPIEGTYVGYHEVNGANWAIPNIIRHWLGVR